MAGCSRQLEVKLGFVGPISGPLADIGKDMLQGTQVAVEELNREGFLIDGRRAHFTLLVEDDKSNRDEGTAAVKRLLDKGIVGAVAHFNSGVAIPNAPLFAAAGVPEFSLATNPKYTHSGWKTAFRILGDDNEQGNALVRLATDKLKIKTPYVVDDQSVVGVGIREIIMNLYKKKGENVPAASTPKEAEKAPKEQYVAMAKKVIENKSDAVLFAGTQEAGVPLLKALRETGWNGYFLGPDGMCAMGAVKEAGAEADSKYLCVLPGAPASWLSNGINFIQLFKSQFNAEPGGQAAFTYESVHVMAEAMERARSIDPHKYVPELTKAPFPGKVQGSIAFDEKGDIKDATTVVYAVVDGKLVEQRALSQ